MNSDNCLSNFLPSDYTSITRWLTFCSSRGKVKMNCQRLETKSGMDKNCIPFVWQDVALLGAELKLFKTLIFKDKPHQAALNLPGGDHLPAVIIQGQRKQIFCSTPEATQPSRILQNKCWNKDPHLERNWDPQILALHKYVSLKILRYKVEFTVYLQMCFLWCVPPKVSEEGETEK